MVCMPGFIWEMWIKEAYKRRLTGEGEMFRERKRTRVSCTECGVTVVSSSLKQHMAWLHGICVPQTRGVNEVGGGPTIFVVSFPRVLKSVKCPVLGCPEVAHSAGRQQKFLMYQHFRSQVAVVQEGAELIPHCELCRMHMPEGRLIKHRRNQICDNNTDMRWHRWDVAITRRCVGATFSLTGEDGL